MWQASHAFVFTEQQVLHVVCCACQSWLASPFPTPSLSFRWLAGEALELNIM